MGSCLDIFLSGEHHKKELGTLLLGRMEDLKGVHFTVFVFLLLSRLGSLSGLGEMRIIS
jgi:hypothetical protein